MHDLRFPEDATEVITELYNDTITKVKPYFRKQDHQDREAQIREIPLSPFLFLNFVEHLLGWLQSGGRGFKYSCLSNSLHADHTASTSADDMLAAALTATDLPKEAEKIKAFANWSWL